MCQRALDCKIRIDREGPIHSWTEIINHDSHEKLDSELSAKKAPKAQILGPAGFKANRLFTHLVNRKQKISPPARVTRNRSLPWSIGHISLEHLLYISLRQTHCFFSGIASANATVCCWKDASCTAQGLGLIPSRE